MARCVDAELDRQQIVGLESRVHLIERQKRPPHQAGTNHQHHRERHFGDDEDEPQALVRLTRNGTTAFPQHELRIAPRGAQRRHDAEEEARQDRHANREDNHRNIERDFCRSRQLTRAQGKQPDQCNLGQHETDDSADGGQHETLCEQLPNQSAASRAECQPHGDLTPAAHRTRQLQARDVHARQQQNQPNGAKQHQKTLAYRAHDDIGQWNDGRRTPGAILGILLCKPGGDRHHLRAHGVLSHA